MERLKIKALEALDLSKTLDQLDLSNVLEASLSVTLNVIEALLEDKRIRIAIWER